MEMFLTLAALSVLSLVITAVLFAAAGRQVLEDGPAEPRADATPRRTPSHFFVDQRTPASPADDRPQPVSIEALLLQIEGHVRLEQAAAQAFQEAPTVEALHMATTSPLVH
jgi:hypothetical protein